MSDQIDPLMATPPAVSDRFEIHGISLSEALDDPVLGPAPEGFHDRLRWSKDDPPELGAEGIEQFRLAHTFAAAGHPIVAMPPPRKAAEIIWQETLRRCGPQYRAAGKNVPLLASTIHGSRTLLANCKSICRNIVAQWRRVQPSNAGDVQFEEYEQLAQDAVIRAAERHDPRRSAFPTYARHRLRGVALDYLAAFRTASRRLVSLDEEDENGEPLYNRIIVHSCFPGDQKSDLATLRLDDLAERARLNERERAVFANWRKGPDRAPWKDMAVHFGISQPRMSQIVGRMNFELPS